MGRRYKGFWDDFHRQVLGGEIQPAIDTFEILRDCLVRFEIADLIILALNGDMDDICRIVEWIKENLEPDVPMHFNRFVAAFQLTHLPLNPKSTLQWVYHIAWDVGLNFV